MDPLPIKELESLVSKGLPVGVKVTGSRFANNDIVVCLTVPSTIPYSSLEPLREQWEQASGWRIALDTFYLSPGIDPQLVATVLGLAPDVTDIKAILLWKDELTIRSTDVPRLFGRDNKVLWRYKLALPGLYLTFQAADSAIGRRISQKWIMRSQKLLTVRKLLQKSKAWCRRISFCAR